MLLILQLKKFEHHLIINLVLKFWLISGFHSEEF